MQKRVCTRLSIWTHTLRCSGDCLSVPFVLLRSCLTLSTQTLSLVTLSIDREDNNAATTSSRQEFTTVALHSHLYLHSQSNSPTKRKDAMMLNPPSQSVSMSIQNHRGTEQRLRPSRGGTIGIDNDNHNDGRRRDNSKGALKKYLFENPAMDTIVDEDGDCEQDCCKSRQMSDSTAATTLTEQSSMGSTRPRPRPRPSNRRPAQPRTAAPTRTSSGSTAAPKRANGFMVVPTAFQLDSNAKSIATRIRPTN